jgi:hypothetical protein
MGFQLLEIRVIRKRCKLIGTTFKFLNQGKTTISLGSNAA